MTGPVDEWSEWTLSLTVTDAPIGGPFGDPNASYATVRARYATYQDLRNNNAQYLDVLKGL